MTTPTNWGWESRLFSLPLGIALPTSVAPSPGAPCSPGSKLVSALSSSLVLGICDDLQHHLGLSTGSKWTPSITGETALPKQSVEWPDHSLVLQEGLSSGRGDCSCCLALQLSALSPEILT